MPASPPTAPPSDRIYSLAELPEAIRRELPKLAYGGGSYSGDKASLLAFLNGQVFHEGDTIAPGLESKQVKQKGVILALQGLALRDRALKAGTRARRRPWSALACLAIRSFAVSSSLLAVEAALLHVGDPFDVDGARAPW